MPGLTVGGGTLGPMSEYQYYEFRAIDRPLTDREMAKLRSCSTRATITRSSFVNEYHWGDLKADPARWVAQYFDAYLYLSSWGTRELALRLPASVLDQATATRYAAGDVARVVGKKGATTILWLAAEVVCQDWDEDETGDPRLGSLVPLRTELASGDLRPLYLAWLLNVQYHAVENDTLEPPVPPGLDRLSAAQDALVELFQLSRALVAAAAVNGPRISTRAGPGRPAMSRALGKWPERDKVALLLRLAQGEDPGKLRAEVLRRLAAAEGRGKKCTTPAEGTRTAEELRASAESLQARPRRARMR